MAELLHYYYYYYHHHHHHQQQLLLISFTSVTARRDQAWWHSTACSRSVSYVYMDIQISLYSRRCFANIRPVRLEKTQRMRERVGIDCSCNMLSSELAQKRAASNAKENSWSSDKTNITLFSYKEFPFVLHYTKKTDLGMRRGKLQRKKLTNEVWGKCKH